MRLARFILCLWLAVAAPFTSVFAQDKPAAPSGNWAGRQFGDVQIETPFEFKEFPDVISNVPAAVRERIDSMHTFLGGTEGTFIVFVTSTTYKPGITLSLDGALKGIINGGAAKVGDSDPQYTSQSIKLSGLDARRASYQKVMADGRAIHMEVMAVVRGQALYQVQGLYFGDTAKTDVERVMASIAIKAAP